MRPYGSLIEINPSEFKEVYVYKLSTETND